MRGSGKRHELVVSNGFKRFQMVSAGFKPSKFIIIQRLGIIIAGEIENGQASLSGDMGIRSKPVGTTVWHWFIGS
jgi:hypothetical protein